MLRNIIFFLKLITLILLFISNLYAEEITIIPLKKPILDRETIEQKLSQSILKPKPKPIKKVEKQKVSNRLSNQYLNHLKNLSLGLMQLKRLKKEKTK